MEKVAKKVESQIISQFTEQKKRLVYLIACLVTIIALFIRIEYTRNTTYHNPIVADARQYVIYGYNLYQYGIYSKSLTKPPVPDSFRSPGYPLLVFLAFKIGGNQGFYSLLIYAQAILGAATVLLAFLLGIRFLSLKWSITSAVLVAISPHLVSMSNYVLTETLFSFLLIAAIFCFHKALPELRIGYFVGAALLFGCAYLTNETVLFLPFLFCLILFVFASRLVRTEIPKSKIFRQMTVFLLVFSLFPAGWAIRNEMNVSKDGIKGSQRALNTLSHGAYPGFMYKSSEYRYFPYREDPMQPRFSSSIHDFKTIFLERFKQRPLRYIVWYLLEKPYYLWSWSILQGQGDIYVYPVIKSLYYSSTIADLSRIAMKLLHPVILIAAFCGLIIFILQFYYKYNVISFSSVFLLVVISYYTLLYTVFAPWPRYSIPLRPELYLWAVWAICNLQYLLEQKKEQLDE